MARYEFRSKLVTVNDSDKKVGNLWVKCDAVEDTCNEWAEDGFIVFSVVCPQPSNYYTYRLTAKRDKEEPVTHTMKFDGKDE